MDFFAEQAHQRALTRKLILLFIVAVAIIVVMVDIPALWLWAIVRHGWIGAFRHRFHWETGVLVVTSLTVVGGILWFSLSRIRSLAEGGPAVARSVGADEVSPETREPQLRRLYNVVEEVAIASGVRVPRVYVLATEDGINAFAAGYEMSDAAVCVTQGCLDHLTRDELQGVIAHEFSHILNGDMRINIRMMGLLYGIQVLGLLGRELMSTDLDDNGRNRDPRGDALLWILGLAMVAAGYVGLVLGRLIQAAVSRSRETLADASAVQFTRQTNGLVGALRKIAAVDEGSSLSLATRDEVAHMMFGEVGPWRSMFATHPPILERIIALEPGYSATALKLFTMRYAKQLDVWRAERYTQGDHFGRVGEGAQEPFNERMPAMTLFAALVGAPGADEAGSSRPPESVVHATQDPESAIWLLLAAMPGYLAGGERDRLMGSALGDDTVDQIRACAGSLSRLTERQRRTVLQFAAQSVLKLPEGRRHTLSNVLDDIARIDAQSDLATYCTLRMLRMRLRNRATLRGARERKLSQCREAFGLVCAVAATIGRPEEADARRVWRVAVHDALPESDLVWPLMPGAWQPMVDAALDELYWLSEPARLLALQALMKTVNRDDEGRTGIAWIRVASTSMDLPTPERAACA
ncbi:MULTISPECIES: M48 family metallopeptidase [Dyella]|uniref:Peptidase M48 n=2 Tax=Dyella TaxID=231454 RepID=A0A4R0YRY3_9GAMM|nr:MULTISPECIES: M48 family metallopeptidase [Dyella]TBR40335.1 peptidase M48 [Dyella terrae]TCI12083.1 peptidase M48 [Dyella soli]